jgi:hypothetical protein
MTVKTIRLNKDEEKLINRILKHFQKDFSSCVKDLFAEQAEDLQDISLIERIKESPSKKDYVSAQDISKLLK